MPTTLSIRERERKRERRVSVRKEGGKENGPRFQARHDRGGRREDREGEREEAINEKEEK